MLRSQLLHDPLKNTYVFARHGQTTANAEGVYAGDLDVALTERGKWQASVLAAELPDHITAVLCSPLKRALETAEIALKPHGITPDTFIIDERLREKSGGLASGMKYTDIAKEYPKEWDRTDKTLVKESLGVPLPGGESDLNVIGRVEQLLVELERRYTRESIVLITHAGVMLAARFLFGKSETEVFDEIPPCGIDTY